MSDEPQLEQTLEVNAVSSEPAELSDEELLERMESDPEFIYQPETIEQEVVEPTVEPEPVEDEGNLEVETEQAEQANAEVEAEVEPEPQAVAPVAEEQTPAVAQPQVAAVSAEADPIDYKAFYESATRQFKANGRELQVKDPNDIIALMQQGANYDKKMAAIKPALQVHRTLEKAGLLDPEKISLMIDAYNGKPEALTKIAQDRGVDLFALEAKAEDYVPEAQLATDREVETSTIMGDLSANPTFNETFSTLSAWDLASQQQILENPRMLYLFQEHKDAGIFDAIQAKVESERLFGRLVGMSNLDAYRLVGDSLYGGNAQQQAQAQPLAQSPVAPMQVAPQVAAPTPIPDPRIAAKQQVVSQKRSAAAAPRTVAKANAAADFNPLAVSDEEIEVIYARQQRLM